MQRKSPGREGNVSVPVLLANVSAVLQGKTQHNRIIRIFPSTVMKLNHHTHSLAANINTHFTLIGLLSIIICDVGIYVLTVF